MAIRLLATKGFVTFTGHNFKPLNAWPFTTKDFPRCFFICGADKMLKLCTPADSRSFILFFHPVLSPTSQPRSYSVASAHSDFRLADRLL